MINQEWIDMFRVIPEENQNTIVIVLQNGAEINVDVMFRFEPNFMVIRGRVGGQTEEGRAFFIPYDQMLYFRIERVTNIAELRDIMDGSALRKAIPPVETPEEPLLPSAAIPGVTDATANRNALLDRIRAARATQVATRRNASQ